MSKATPGATLYTGNATTGMPDATVAGNVNQFAVIGLAGIDVNNAFTVQWSALADLDSWPTPGTDAARTVQSGKQTLSARYGKVTGIAGGDFFGYVFQQRGITKMTYVGGDVVFAFDTFEESRGCVGYDRFAQIDDLIIFESEYGYHALQNDQIADIGFGRVDDTYTPTDAVQMQDVAKNPFIQTVFFGQNDLAYNYKTDQWTRIPAFAGQGYYDIDSSDGVIGQIVYSGANVDFQDSSGGVAATATFETGEFELIPSERAMVDGARLRHTGASLTSTRVGVRDLLSGSVTYATGTALNSRSGMTHYRGGANKPEGRYVRGEFVFGGGFDTINGADFEFFGSGKT
jgi:hypothetical protein